VDLQRPWAVGLADRHLQPLDRAREHGRGGQGDGHSSTVRR
jgi:hypothetical protein